MKRFIRLQACAVAAAALLGSPAFAQSAPPEPVRVALKGYDPVAYFTEGKLPPIADYSHYDYHKYSE